MYFKLLICILLSCFASCTTSKWVNHIDTEEDVYANPLESPQGTTTALYLLAKKSENLSGALSNVICIAGLEEFAGSTPMNLREAGLKVSLFYEKEHLFSFWEEEPLGVVDSKGLSFSILIDNYTLFDEVVLNGDVTGGDDIAISISNSRFFEKVNKNFDERSSRTIDDESVGFVEDK